eukprot:gnl/Chilomastix_cuspidata/6559.p2 GENE.gnl/Chilomastix_cuspidata/6559~~gnl/Chilomastix_cuspidata/6559.p2  ORF type:complete len:190 (+),score=87.14 gnl/Chilomastix_cuspidata/6559:327-896(+)
MSSRSHRLTTDFLKLKMSSFTVEMIDDTMDRFYVFIHGPDGSPYEGGLFKLRVTIPPEYPYKSPSIGFVNKIWHPNVCSGSGTICLDVINQTWTPIFGLVNIFEHFLPQLLLYPNAEDPLNSTAARQFLYNRDEFDKVAREYVRMYCVPEAAGIGPPRAAASPIHDALPLQQSSRLEFSEVSEISDSMF